VLADVLGTAARKTSAQSFWLAARVQVSLNVQVSLKVTAQWGTEAVTSQFSRGRNHFNELPAAGFGPSASVRRLRTAD